MQIVIDIPEEIVKYIKNNGCLSVIYIDEVAKAIQKGTPLPEEHNNLIDFNSLEEVAELMHIPYGRSGYGVFVNDIREYARPIIASVDKGADTSESEE